MKIYANFPVNGEQIDTKYGSLEVFSEEHLQKLPNHFRFPIADFLAGVPRKDKIPFVTSPFSNDLDGMIMRKGKFILISGVGYNPDDVSSLFREKFRKGEVLISPYRENPPFLKGAIPIRDRCLSLERQDLDIYYQGIWKIFFGRAPKKRFFNIGRTRRGLTKKWDDLMDELVRNTELIKGIAKYKKLFLRYAPSVGEDQHEKLTFLKCIVHFGKDLPFIADHSKEWSWNKRWAIFREIPLKRIYLLKKSTSMDFLSALRKIPEDIKISDKMRVGDIKRTALRYLYDPNIIKDPDCASVCAQVGMSQENFCDFQEYWLGRSIPEYETIPDVGVVSQGGYKMYRLHREDPRGPLLGLFTNCCQYPGGVGESCAKHGMEDPDGCFFVVEKHGRIIAQSWAWRKDSTVVFDNVEALSGDYMKIIANLYQQIADRMIGKLGIHLVSVGGGYDKLGVDKYWPSAGFSEEVSNLHLEYSDADDQYLISLSSNYIIANFNISHMGEEEFVINDPNEHSWDVITHDGCAQLVAIPDICDGFATFKEAVKEYLVLREEVV